MTTTNNNRSNDYQAKQMIARRLEGDAAAKRQNNMNAFEALQTKIEDLCDAIIEKAAGQFAAAVAETVKKSANPYAFTPARVSSKQAWILACAAVENGIEY